MSFPVFHIAKGARFALAVSALAFLSAPAQARIWLPINSSLGGKIFVLLSSSSHCVAYSFDQNGNRILVTSAAVGSSAVTWGSGSYGCFVWTQ